MEKVLNIDGISCSGCILGSLLHEVSICEGAGTQKLEGFLFGDVNLREVKEVADAHEGKHSRIIEIVIDSFVRTGKHFSFYNDLGEVDEVKLSELLQPRRSGALTGMFIARKGGEVQPSLREIAAYRSLLMVRHQQQIRIPLILLVLSVSIEAGENTQTFRYQCFHQPFSTGHAALTAVPCRIKNLQHDSQSEFNQFQPAPPPLLSEALGGEWQQAHPITGVLGSILAEIPPLYLQGQEAVFDSTMHTLLALVAELQQAEVLISQLRLERTCLKEVLYLEQDGELTAKRT